MSRKARPSWQEIEESALTLREPGAVEYMMSCSPALREAVARILVNYPNDAARNSYLLDAYLRYYLNDELAEQSLPKSKYAPAIARAKLVSDRNQYIENNLEINIYII